MSVFLSGRAWHDSNANGLEEFNEAGIANVRVDLLTSTGNLQTSTYTDSSGMYALASLMAGSFKVRFVAPSGHTFTSSNVGNDDAIDSDSDALGMTAAYTLTDWQMISNIDAGLRTNSGSMTANNDVLTIAENISALSSNVLSNDVANGVINVTAIRTGAESGSGSSGTVGQTLLGNYGMLMMNPDGRYTYTLNNANTTVNALRAGQSLQEFFTYTANSGGATDSAQLSVTITGSNDIPNSNADTVSMTRSHVSVSSNVLANDSDPERDSLTVSAIRTGNENGTGTSGSVGNGLTGNFGVLTIQANGAYSYALDQNNAAVRALSQGQSLNDVFTYTSNDGQGGQDKAQLTITIQGSNAAITASNDVANMTDQHASVSSNVLSNDLDPEGDTLTVTSIRTGAENATGMAGSIGNALNGSYGSLLLAADGRYTYTVNQNNPAVRSLDAGQSLQEVFTYSCSDGKGSSDTAQLTITISGSNSAPIAMNDVQTITEDSWMTAGSVLGNDTDAEGHALTVTAVRTGSEAGTGTAGTIGTALNGTYGTFVLNANGTYSYVLNNSLTAVNALDTGESLVDVFTYTINDGHSGNDQAHLVMTIQGVNDAPVAINDLATMNLNHASVSSNVLGNDTDAEADTLSVTTIRTGTEIGTGTTGVLGNALVGSFGSLTLNANGTYSYALNHNHPSVRALAAGQSLNDNFTYAMNDGRGGSDQAQLTITIQGSSGAIVAANDVASMTEQHASITSNVLSNDVDPEGDALNVTAIRTGAENAMFGVAGSVGVALNGSYGSLNLAADGRYTYTLNNNNATVRALNVGQSLQDVFTYTCSDGKGSSDLAQLSITIQGVNNAPVAVNDSLSVSSNTAYTITAENLFGSDGTGANNDNDVDHAAFSHIVITRLPAANTGVLQLNEQVITANSTVSLNDLNANKLKFVPATNFSGNADFAYQVSDGTALSNTANVNIAVTPISTGDDYSNNIQTTGRVTVNASQTGKIEVANDVDWFAVNLEAGKRYQIDLEGAPTGTLSDTFLRGIYTAQGNLIANTNNDDFVGLNSRVMFTPSETNTYFISAGAYGNLTGSYRLSVASSIVVNPLDDYSNNTSTTGSIAPLQTRNGNIELPIDTDWFRAELQAGTHYRIDLRGAQTNSGTLSDPFLKGIFDSSGTLLNNTSNDDYAGGLNSRVDFIPTSSGTYYIAAGGFGPFTGTYQLAMDTVMHTMPAAADLLEGTNSMGSLLEAVAPASNTSTTTNLTNSISEASTRIAELSQLNRLLEQPIS